MVRSANGLICKRSSSGEGPGSLKGGVSRVEHVRVFVLFIHAVVMLMNKKAISTSCVLSPRDHNSNMCKIYITSAQLLNLQHNFKFELCKIR